MREVRYGPLLARVTGGDDGKGGGTGPVVVLLHGFGAPGHDLVQLGMVMPVPDRVRFVFPEAPLSLGAAYGEGRAWWMLDIEALQRRAQGKHSAKDERVREAPEGMIAARKQVIACLDAIERDLCSRAHGLILGGFSQGAMVSCDVALHDGRPLDGLVLLSSTIVARRDWEPRMAARKGLKIFQSHGTEDPLLPYDEAVVLRELWKKAGADVSFVEFRGGHTIPPQVLTALTRFIVDSTAPPPP